MTTVQSSLRHRLALLATSSFGALSIIACAGSVTALLPSAALADDEPLYLVYYGEVLNGPVDFSDAAGGVTMEFGFGGTWYLSGQSILSPSSDTLVNLGEFYGIEPGTMVAESGTVLDFGAGSDTFTTVAFSSKATSRSQIWRTSRTGT